MYVVRYSTAKEQLPLVILLLFLILLFLILLLFLFLFLLLFLFLFFLLLLLLPLPSGPDLDLHFVVLGHQSFDMSEFHVEVLVLPLKFGETLVSLPSVLLHYF